MDKYEIRRQNLRALLHSHCGGKAATLADLIGRSASYVSRMMYPEGKEGKKRIGEDMRNIIEDAFSLKRGSLDEVGFPSNVDTENVPIVQQSEVSSAGGAGRASTEAGTPIETTLERLDAPEKAFLELYRRATDEGKVMIYRTALAVPKTDD